jgi:hypothetical protein
MANEFQPGAHLESACDSADPRPQEALSEDLALAQLKDRGLSADALENISQNAALMKSRKVRIALAAHPHTPRRIALRVIRELYTFDLMQFSLLPAVPSDLKHVADQALLTRLPSITLGERISLARRESSAVAGALLHDKEAQVWQTALENPRLTEATLVKALREEDSQALVEAVRRHTKWSLRAEVRAVLSSASEHESRQLLVAQGLDGIEVGSAHGRNHAADDTHDSEDRGGDGENGQRDD